MWLTPPFGIIGDNMTTRKWRIQGTYLRVSIAARWYSLHNILDTETRKQLRRSTRFILFTGTMGETTAIELDAHFQNMGGSVSG